MVSEWLIKIIVQYTRYAYDVINLGNTMHKRCTAGGRQFWISSVDLILLSIECSNSDSA